MTVTVVPAARSVKQPNVEKPSATMSSGDAPRRQSMPTSSPRFETMSKRLGHDGAYAPSPDTRVDAWLKREGVTPRPEFSKPLRRTCMPGSGGAVPQSWIKNRPDGRTGTPHGFGFYSPNGARILGA